MLKWAISVALIVLVLGLLQLRWAERLRLGRLPGDLQFRLRGRSYSFPFMSTLLLSLLATALLRLL